MLKRMKAFFFPAARRRAAAWKADRAAYEASLVGDLQTAQIALPFDDYASDDPRRSTLVGAVIMGTLPTEVHEWSRENLSAIPTTFACGDLVYFKFVTDNDALAFKLRWL